MLTKVENNLHGTLYSTGITVTVASHGAIIRVFLVHENQWNEGEDMRLVALTTGRV